MKAHVHSIIALLILCFSSQLLSHAGDNFKKNTPIFYVALAEASYQGSKGAAQKTLNKLLGPGNATVVDLKDHKSSIYGSTHFLLVQDKAGSYHIGIEGSNSTRNWVGNTLMPVRGTCAEYDVPPRIRESMQAIIEAWKKKYKHIVAVVGHSQGGMYASQLKAAHKDKFKHTVVITFNGFKIKEKPDQYHFAIKTEHASTICGPSGRYIKIGGIGSAHWKLLSNHKMKYFLSGLKDKTWAKIL